MKQQPTRESFTALRNVADATYLALLDAEKAGAPAAELERLALEAHRAHRAVWAHGWRSGSPENTGWLEAARRFKAQGLKLAAAAGR